MRIGLLQCGQVAPVLVDRFGDYPTIYGDLLGPEVQLLVHDVQGGPVPEDPTGFDGWLISGSAQSTYDDLPWIAPTERFLRALVDRNVPTVAICFGHQLLAQALGGRVELAPGGWGVGAHDYRLIGPPRTPGWPDRDRVRLIASHQDQVTRLPDGADVIASTDHCPIAGFTLGPAALALQPHPEFSGPLSHALTTARRERIGDVTSDEALASLEPDRLDRDLVARWMIDFWRSTA